jgi:hypothetical protein
MKGLYERRIHMNAHKKLQVSARGGIEMARHLRRILVASVLVATLLISLGASGAWAATVVPAEGTIGTTFTILGSNFGAKRGTIFIGSIAAQVLAWSDTQIDCLIRVPMSPGEYDLELNPQGKGSPVILSTFAIRPPSINPPGVRPQFVSPGQEITLGGAFFGSDGLQKVEIESLQGEKRPCHIVDWAMDSITFKLPRGVPGIFHLKVTNGVGTDVQPWWGTFATPPPTMPGGINYGGDESSENATAVTYQNKLWVFWPGKNHNVYYRIWDGTTWSSNKQLIDSNGSAHQTYAQLNPVVVDGYLYMFETRLDGDIHITQYNPLAVDPDTMEITPIWISRRHLPIGVYDVKGRFAAVYNHVRKYVEIYITPDDTTIKRLIYYPTTNAAYDYGAVPIEKVPNYPTIAPHLTAVFNGNELDNDYVTYLSWSDTEYGFVAELKDGVVLHQLELFYWRSFDPNRGPSLVDLGEKYLAVIYNWWENQSSYQKYDKEKHAAVGGTTANWDVDVPFSSKESCHWAPNGIVFSKKVADSTSPTGDHMESRFYAIVESNPIADEANWQFVECEYLGYWKPTGPANYVDFQGRDLPTNDAVNQRLADTFSSWTVIGLVDMPPFVRNGHGECTDYLSCITDAEISFEAATTEGLSGEYSAGAYVESGRRSPVTYDISAGYAGGFETSEKFTYTLKSSIEENLEGRIMAFYIAPRFNVYTLEWYDLNGSPTGIYIQALETLTPSIRKEAFDPEIGPDVAYYQGKSGFTPPYLDVAKTAAEIAQYSSKLPMHASESDRDRLDTYFRNPTTAPFNFQSIVIPELSQSSWGLNSPGGFEWAIDEEHSVDNGFYCDIKIGSEIAHRVGFGVEGSFKVLVNTKTQKSVEAITDLRSQSPIDSDPSRVTSFNVEGYWLKPSASGYWVPNNRKGMGDTPWFITYRVTDYHP